jgi:hypothetical protein
VYIYYLVVNNTTVDYNAFWCNGLDADSLTLLQPAQQDGASVIEQRRCNQMTPAQQVARCNKKGGAMMRTAPVCQGGGDVVEMVPAYQTVNLNQYNKCQAHKAGSSFWGARLTNNYSSSKPDYSSDEMPCKAPYETSNHGSLPHARYSACSPSEYLEESSGEVEPV